MASDIKSKINICDDVFGVIAGIAATSVEGVKSVSGGLTKNAIPFMDGKNLKDGIIIEGNKNALSVNISLILKNSANLQKTCVEVQEKVKEALEGMLDVNIKEVIVRVDNTIEDKNEK